MKATVIGVGTELLVGHTPDTNTAELAADLIASGAEVEVSFRVADRLEPLARELEHALCHHDLVVTTGGLGPTPDDLTREAVARAVGAPLVMDPEMLEQIRAFFAEMGREMPEVNRRQAMRPEGAAWIENPRGTAPGFFWQGGGRTLVALPGPPEEWRPMWQAVKRRLGLTPKPRYRKVLKTFGLGESQLAEILGPLFTEVGSYAKPWGVELVAHDEDLVKKIRKKLKGKIWGEDEDTLAGLVHRRLAAEGKTLAVMESVTGGLVAELLTDVPGASKTFRGGMVSYTREAKVRFGVPEEVLLAHGQVSAPTARAMAEAARRQLDADFGLAVTGVAGPEALEGHPVGTVFVGLATDRGAQARAYRFPDQGRERVRLRAAYAALAYFWSEA